MRLFYGVAITETGNQLVSHTSHLFFEEDPSPPIFSTSILKYLSLALEMGLPEPQTSNDTIASQDIFPSFGDLPLEIRLKIWKDALPEPARMIIYLLPGHFFPLSQNIQARQRKRREVWSWGTNDDGVNLAIRLLLVNREAHDVVASTYTFLPSQVGIYDETQDAFIMKRIGLLFDHAQDTMRVHKKHYRTLKGHFHNYVHWFPNFPIRIVKIWIEGDYVEIAGDRPEVPSMKERQGDGNLLLRCIEDFGDDLGADP